MAQTDLPLVLLRTFHLVVVHRGLSNAARDLGVTQPAVTQQIRRLEQAVGTPLFRRDGRRLALTESGEILETFTRRIFQLTDSARDALQGVSALRTGHLKVGASRTAGAYYVSPLLDRFKRRHPGVRVSLSVGNSQMILAGVLDFALHAGLVAGLPSAPQLCAWPLIRDRLVAVLPPAHRLASKRLIPFETLAECPLILREPGSATRQIIEDAFRARGLTVTPTMELESNEAIKSAVVDGIGVAVMAHAAVAQEVADGRLVARRVGGPLSLEFTLVFHQDRVLSPVLASFLASLPKRSRRAAGRSLPGRREGTRSPDSHGGSHE